MATKEEVIKLMTLMALAYPNYEVKEQAANLYCKMLADIDPRALEAAAQQIMATSVFFPSIAEWRKAAFDLLTNKAALPTAFDAWEEVMRKIGQRMSYDEPEWSHPLIARTVKTVGFKRLCNFNLDELSYERTNFYKVYESYLSRADEDMRMLPSVRAASQELTAGINELTAKLTAGKERPNE